MYAVTTHGHPGDTHRSIPGGKACSNVTPLRSSAGAAVLSPKIETFLPGQSIFHEGSEATCFFEIVSGNVRCCGLTADGRRQIYRFASADEMLGLGGDEVYSHSAEAVTAVAVRRHRLATLDAAMALDEHLRERVVQALRDELNSVRTQMMMLGRMTAAERIGLFLCELARRSGSTDGSIHLTMTRGDIADYLGLTLETVSRKLNALKRSGAIEMATPSRVRIKDVHRLETISEAA